MNDKKICFIYCVNDQQTFEESVRYIYTLNMPEGYVIDVIKIEDATSICSGYNRAMKQTDAKYKIYLHQDVFIINRNFIYDIIDIFTQNEKLGLLGVVGAKTIPSSGVWWESEEKFGQVYDSHTNEMKLLKFNDPSSTYESVQAIDGLIMATQYDITWREDLFDGWHFYDISQSNEFIIAGYQVGIVKQDLPWCVHDCGIVNVKNDFHLYRDLFIHEYKDFYTENNQKYQFYRYGRNSKIKDGYDIFCPQGISIGDNVLINNNCWLLLPYNNYQGNPRIIIEDGCDIGKRCNISAVNKIVLEKNVIIGPNVHISDHNHQYKSIGIPIKQQGVDSFNNTVVIGEGSWIGANSVIAGNVKIGKGCVIGANTIVNKSIPDYSVAVGNPAKIVKIYDKESGKWIKTKGESDVARIISLREKQVPLISICIPTYNRSRELRKSLESIYSQIGSDLSFEIIVSDNDSSDETEQVAAAFSSVYPNLKYVKNKSNIGSELNILNTIEHSTGKFIFLHGDDDYFKQGSLYKIFNIVDQNRECGLFFINVLNNNKEVSFRQGLDQFISEASINCTFISSIIMNRLELKKINDNKKYIGSFINQVYLQLSILVENPDFCLINESIFLQEGNHPTGYNYGEVFIKNYLDILYEFRQYGLSASTIKTEKRKMLDSIIYWYKFVLANDTGVTLDGFFKIFEEYYHQESYFEDALQIFEEINNMEKGE